MSVPNGFLIGLNGFECFLMAVHGCIMDSMGFQWIQMSFESCLMDPEWASNGLQWILLDDTEPLLILNGASWIPNDFECVPMDI